MVLRRPRQKDKAGWLIRSQNNGSNEKVLNRFHACKAKIENVRQTLPSILTKSDRFSYFERNLLSQALEVAKKRKEKEKRESV